MNTQASAPTTRPETRHRFEMPHIYVILFVFTAIAAILTHFVPAGLYDRIPGPSGRTTIAPDSFRVIDSNPLGLVDFMLAIPKGLREASMVVFFTFIIGGMFMVHRAWTFALGNTHDMLEAAALLEKIDGTLATQYAQRTGADEAAMLDVMDEETWMTAQEAVDSKFVDRIANQDEQDEPAAASTQWDLSAYANAPAPAAPIGAHVTASAPQIKVTTMNERVRLGRRVQMARAPAA